jgi:glycerophosphoryl diester phosphodiesterase
MKPKIIAHRGASAYVRENTLAAFERAIALEANMVEFDVRRTRDRQLIVYHDPEIGKRPIRKLTYAEIQQLDPDIPRLEAVLETCQGKIHLDVELKEMGYEPQVMRTLLRFFAPEDFVVTSFHPFSLKRIKRHFPENTTGLLFSTVTADVCKTLRWSAKSVHKRVHNMQVDFIAPDWNLLHADILANTLAAQLPIWVWTVNDEQVMHQLMQDSRIAGIITDRPDLGLQLLYPPSPREQAMA